MADPTNTGPMPDWLNKGLGMMFKPKPKLAAGGMAPPPVATVSPPPAAATPPPIFTPQKPWKVEKGLKDAGAD